MMVSLSAVVEGYRRLPFGPHATDPLIIGISGAAWIAAAVAMALGGLTKRVIPAVVLVELVVIAVRLTTPGAGDATSYLLQTGIAAALALTGPGAYSLDAHFRGRREIVLRPREKAFH
jgi:uncharacterized membrane protein YphA (DoxX/SURF4 family)